MKLVYEERLSDDNIISTENIIGCLQAAVGSLEFSRKEVVSESETIKRGKLIFEDISVGCAIFTSDKDLEITCTIDVHSVCIMIIVDRASYNKTAGTIKVSLSSDADSQDYCIALLRTVAERLAKDCLYKCFDRNRLTDILK